MEDVHGQAMAITIDNYFHAPALTIAYKRIINIFPIGLVMIVREPYVGLGLWTGLPEIRVSVPTDIQVLAGDGGREWNFEPLVGCVQRFMGSELIDVWSTRSSFRFIVFKN